MKKQSMIIAALMLTATSVFAADNVAQPAATAGTQKPHKEWTLDEARKHAHEHADKLDKMTPQEWAEHEKKRSAFFDKWNKMTPEQKEQMRQTRKEKHAANNGTAVPANTATAPTTLAPSTPTSDNTQAPATR